MVANYKQVPNFSHAPMFQPYKLEKWSSCCSKDLFSITTVGVARGVQARSHKNFRYMASGEDYRKLCVAHGWVAGFWSCASKP